MRLAHDMASEWALLIRRALAHNTPKNKKATISAGNWLKLAFKGMTMKRLLIAAFLVATAAGMSACSESTAGAGTAQAQMFQVSSIHWDEVTAADRAAHVNNNGLIMMR